MKMIKDRLKEASTWGGISALLLANAMLMGGDYQPLLGGLALLTGALAVILKDPESKT